MNMLAACRILSFVMDMELKTWQEVHCYKWTISGLSTPHIAVVDTNNNGIDNNAVEYREETKN